MKFCRRCSTEQDPSAFTRNAARKDGLSDWCRACNAIYNSAYWRRKRPAAPARRGKGFASTKGWTEDFRIRQYGLSACELTRMRIEQNDRCKVCICREITGRALAIDHDHETGRVRGLLCTRCNTALGLLDDDSSRLEAALVYLAA